MPNSPKFCEISNFLARPISRFWRIGPARPFGTRRVRACAQAKIFDFWPEDIWVLASWSKNPPPPLLWRHVFIFLNRVRLLNCCIIDSDYYGLNFKVTKKIINGKVTRNLLNCCWKISILKMYDFLAEIYMNTTGAFSGLLAQTSIALCLSPLNQASVCWMGW